MINAYNDTTQTVSTDSVVKFSDVVKLGCGISYTEGGGTFKLNRPGMYLVIFHATMEDNEGAASLQLVADGDYVPGTFSGGKYESSLATLVRVLPSCPIVDNSKTIAVENVGDDEITITHTNIIIVRVV